MLSRQLKKMLSMQKVVKSFLLFGKPSLKQDTKFMSTNSQFKEVTVDVPWGKISGN